MYIFTRSVEKWRDTIYCPLPVLLLASPFHEKLARTGWHACIIHLIRKDTLHERSSICARIVTAGATFKLTSVHTCLFQHQFAMHLAYLQLSCTTLYTAAPW